MKRESIIRGIAKWAGKEIKPRLPQFSPIRLAIATCEQLAQMSPQAAEAVATSFFGPVVPALLNAAGPQFDAVADALCIAAKNEEKMLISLPGMFGEPKPYAMSEADFRALVAEIRTAEANS